MAVIYKIMIILARDNGYFELKNGHLGNHCMSHIRVGEIYDRHELLRHESIFDTKMWTFAFQQ